MFCFESSQSSTITRMLTRNLFRSLWVGCLFLGLSCAVPNRALAQSADFPFALPEEVKNQPVRLMLQLDKARPIQPDFFGFNTQLVSPAYKYSTPALAETARELVPGHLRFPSNRAANFYSWKNDRPVVPDIPAYDNFTLAVEIRTLSKVMAEQNARADWPGFAEFTKTLGATPVIVVGLQGNTPEEAIEWVKDVQARGLPLPRVELGTQAYLRGLTVPQQETARGYLDLARPMAKALKDAFPEIKVAVNGGPDSGSNRAWNNVISQESFYDAVSQQFYIGGFVADDVVDIGPKQALTAEAQVDKFLESQIKLFPGKKIWLTEWSLNAPTRSKYPHNGMSAIMIASAAARMLERSDIVELATYQQFAARQGLIDITPKGNRVVYGDSLTFRLLGRLSTGATRQIPVSVTPGATEALPIQPVIAAAAATETEVRILVVNRLPIPRRVAIEGLGDSPSIAANCLPLISLMRSSTPTSENNLFLKRTGSGSVEVPGYSVSLFEISIKSSQ